MEAFGSIPQKPMDLQLLFPIRSTTAAKTSRLHGEQEKSAFDLPHSFLASTHSILIPLDTFTGSSGIFFALDSGCWTLPLDNFLLMVTRLNCQIFPREVHENTLSSTANQ
jgi:hypothetical protein